MVSSDLIHKTFMEEPCDTSLYKEALEVENKIVSEKCKGFENHMQTWKEDGLPNLNKLLATTTS